MSKHLFLFLAIILVAGGVYVLSSRMSDGESSDISALPSREESSSKLRASLQSLLLSGKSMKCGFDNTNELMSQKGVGYISGNKFRGDFTVATEGAGQFDMHVIRDGEYVYSWGGLLGADKGFKMKASDAPKEKDKEGKSFDFDKEIDFDCSSWSPDASLFELPSGVVFQDFSEALNAVRNATPDLGGVQCTVCDQAPAGTAREQCRLALGCK